MYTLVFKTKTEDLIVFDVLKTTIFGKQKVVGNVFCIEDADGSYKATTSIYTASHPKVKWDGGRKSYYLVDITLKVCEQIADKDKYTDNKY